MMPRVHNYREAVISRFPDPSPEMRAYIDGFAHRETRAELDAQQQRWERLSENEQALCRKLAKACDAE